MSPVRAAVVVAALFAGGCQDTPSYALRWRVAPRSNAPTPETATPQDEVMTNATVCSRVGVSRVEAWVIDEFGNVADTFWRPCFPDGFRNPLRTVRGDELSAGDYTIILAGTRANEVPWGACPGESAEGDNPSCDGLSVESFLDGARAEDLELCNGGSCGFGLGSCDCQEFTAVDEQTERLADFVIPAPPDCEDGIDGDEDGLVDQLDPGCQLGDSEATPALQPEITLDVSVLSGNPNATCNSIRVGRLAVSIDGQAIDPISCNVGITRLTTPLEVGAHDIALTGITGTVPVTVEKTFDFVVTERGVTDPTVLEVDFNDTDVLQPIEGPIRFNYEVIVPDGDIGAVPCSDSRVGATEFRHRLLDLAGNPIAQLPTFAPDFEDGMPIEQGPPLDGSPSTCWDALPPTEELVRWGGYLIEIEAFTEDGELCWSNADAPEPLVPQDFVSFDIEPVEGAPQSCFGTAE